MSSTLRSSKIFFKAAVFSARFKGQHLAENTAALKKILDERRVDDILEFLQESHQDATASFLVIFPICCVYWSLSFNKLFRVLQSI